MKPDMVEYQFLNYGNCENIIVILKIDYGCLFLLPLCGHLPAHKVHVAKSLAYFSFTIVVTYPAE